MNHNGNLEARLQSWLAIECGVDEPRRIVRADPSRILVSKCPAGFASELTDVLDRLPELFDLQAMRTAYEAEAAANPGSARSGCWHRGIIDLLARLCCARQIPAQHEEEVRIGIDSAAALLDTILWSGPRAGEAYEPSSSEAAAYVEAMASNDRDLFTRAYGVFEGAQVVNHCPGAPFARAMMAQAWEICTGTRPPTATDEAVHPLESGA